MTLGPKTFAPFLATAFVFWPIIAYMGAQGYTGAIAIAALLGLVYVRLRGVRIYALASLCFLGWVVIAGLWAPESKAFLTGNLFAGSFSMDMPGLRFGLTALAGIGIFVATKEVADGAGRRSMGVILGAGFIQFGGVLVTAVFMQDILNLLAPISDPVREMPQNLIRNANAFLLLLPLLLAWLWFHQRRLMALALGLFAFAAFVQTGTQTAIVGTFFMLAGMGLVMWLPKNGFRVMFSALSFYVLAAPALLGWALSLLRESGLPLPRSFFSRSYSWELVSGKITEAPIFGHGPEASHTWKETFGDHPEWLADATARYGDTYAWDVYPVVPIHPHNMPLQVWAETGLIGAFLAAVFLLLLGWRLRDPQDWPPTARFAAAGLIGVAVSIGSFAYSMWNEAYWASVMLAAAAIFLQARHTSSSSS